MDEIPFLSAEVDNELESIEDDSEHSSSVILTDKEMVTESINLEPNAEGRMASKQETFEICQSTVNPGVRVNSENFKIQRVIGKGGYGKVFLVQKVDGVDQGKLYAMKVLKKARLICNEKDKAHTVSERNILEMLRHPFLVKLHYAFQNHSNLYIVLEYCPGGELFNYLEREGSLLENSACFYTAEIALAIGHLHSLGIIYRDLKSENVLLDRQGHVKLTDFGLSKEGVRTTNTFCGTIEYMAPEIIRCEGHGKAVDWWSLGTLLFDMLSGGPPFTQEESREATTHKILTAPLNFPPSFSPEVTSLIRGLLKRDPKERLGSKGDVEEIKRHKFFRRHEINWSDVLHRRLRPPFRPKLLADNDVSMFDPTFTTLQPVVSPSDTGRSIPPDLFQGFSYVAPSVCEDVMREPWMDNQLSAQRRHYGVRGSLSTGRLRRLEANSSTGLGKVTDGIQLRPAPQSSKLCTDALNHFSEVPNGKATRMFTEQPVGVASAQQTSFPLTAPFPSNCGSILTSRTGVASCDANNQSGPMGGVPLQEEDEDVADIEEEEEELEEENIPGAQAIHNTISYCGNDAFCGPIHEPRPISSVKSITNFDKVVNLTHSRSGTQLKSMYPSNPVFPYRQPGPSAVTPSMSTMMGTNPGCGHRPTSTVTTNPGVVPGHPTPSTTSSTSKCSVM